MACKSCFTKSPVNKDAPSRYGACDVCATVDNNEQPKPTIFCKLCNAWICDGCKLAIGRRGWAMVITGFEKLFSQFK